MYKCDVAQPPTQAKAGPLSYAASASRVMRSSTLLFREEYPRLPLALSPGVSQPGRGRSNSPLPQPHVGMRVRTPPCGRSRSHALLRGLSHSHTPPRRLRRSRTPPRCRSPGVVVRISGNRPTVMAAGFVNLPTILLFATAP